MPQTCYLWFSQRPSTGAGLTCCSGSVSESRRPLPRRYVSTHSMGPRHPIGRPGPPQSVRSWNSVRNKRMVSIISPWNPETCVLKCDWPVRVYMVAVPGMKTCNQDSRILFHFILPVCSGRGILKFKGPGQWLRWSRGCTNGTNRTNGKGSQKQEFGLENNQLHWSHNSAQGSWVYSSSLCEGKKLLSECFCPEKLGMCILNCFPKSNNVLYHWQLFNKATAFLVFRFVHWNNYTNNFSNAGIVSWQIDLLVIYRLSRKISIHCKNTCGYVQVSMLCFTFKKKIKFVLYLRE